jgi:ADP-heptose:LPS heptosyltransferase
MQKKILIIQTAFIGDVILATAVIEQAHIFFPDAAIDVLVRKGNESLLSNHPIVRDVLVWDKKVGKYKNLWQLLKTIRLRKYDRVINLQRFAASGFLTAFSGASERFGFQKNPLSFLFSRKFDHQIGTLGNPAKHEVERNLAMVSDWGMIAVKRPKLYPSAADVTKVAEYVHSKFVTISPSSVWFTKQTPPEVWIELIRSLSDVKIYLLGGPTDIALCERIMNEAANPNVEILAGNLSLLQSAALMQNATMNYTNDSAPMHLCSAVNAPVAAVYCSTIPEFGFGPLSDRSVVVQSRESLDCKPCGLHGYASCPKGHFKCGLIQNRDLLDALPS